MSASDIQEEPDWSSLNLIGRSRAFCSTLALLQRCAAVDATVLLCGETGTGKELASKIAWTPTLRPSTAGGSGTLVPDRRWSKEWTSADCFL